MGGSWVEERFEDYKLQLSAKQQSLNAWELINLVGTGHFSKGMDRQTLSMGINEVYLELILDVLKQVGRGLRDGSRFQTELVRINTAATNQCVVPGCLCRAT